jgi:hypothetical protein
MGRSDAKSSNPNITLFLFLIIIVVLFIIVNRSIKKKKERETSNLLKVKNDFIEKMSQLTDDGWKDVLGHYQDYQIEALEAASLEAKKRSLQLDYEKIKLQIDFYKEKKKNETSKSLKNDNFKYSMIILLVIIVIALLYFLARTGFFGQEAARSLDNFLR